MSKSNNDKLIEMVKSDPVLYDMSHPAYKNIYLKNKKWEDLGAKLNMSGEDVKSKWRNLRDTYSKYLKSTGQITSKSYTRYSKWQWASSMEFLKDYTGFASIDTNNITLETEDEKETGGGSQNNKEHEQNFNTVPLSNSRTPRPRFRKRNLDQHPVEKIFSYLNPKPEKYTPTEHVMLGYAKTIDGFSERRKIITKMKIAQILMEAELEEAEEHTPTEPKRSQNDSSCTLQQPFYTQTAAADNSDPNKQDAIFAPSRTVHFAPLVVKVETDEV